MITAIMVSLEIGAILVFLRVIPAIFGCLMGDTAFFGGIFRVITAILGGLLLRLTWY